jgi:hypothetical protein
VRCIAWPSHTGIDVSTIEESVIVNGSLQTLEQSIRTRAANPLTEALERGRSGIQSQSDIGPSERQVPGNLGPSLGVPAPDVMTSSRHMLRMPDEFEALFGGAAPGFVVRQPVGPGCLPGRDEATGCGVGAALREGLKRLGIERAAAGRFVQSGGTVIAVSSWDGDEACRERGWV